MNIIEIDGSHGEAGGQILRTATGLSAVTGKPFKLFNIRKGRCTQGMKAQHLAGVLAVAKICNAELKGAELDSCELEFYPNKIIGGDYKFDVGTAGAVTLVLQSLVIPAIHADTPITFEISGGTHVKWAPLYDFFQHIFCDYMKKIGIDIHADIIKYGFYPKGGGLVKVSIKPAVPNSIYFIKSEKLKYIDILSITSLQLKDKNVAERQANAVKQSFDNIRNTNIIYVNSLSPGSALHIHAHYDNYKLSGSSLGELGKTAEQVGKEATGMLKKQISSNACMDEHMADQILPFMALAVTKNDGASNQKCQVKVAEITDHVRTNIWVIEKFLPVKFNIDEKERIIICNNLS